MARPRERHRIPGEFIPILEATGLILPVGEWVLRKACTQARAWLYAGIPTLRVCVNLSAVQFRQRQLAGRIEKILSETNLPGSALELEITESALMEDADYSRDVLMRLRKLGIRVALDDFGTGYSSLSLLNSFPVDSLKIDRLFIRDIVDDKDHRSICSAIIAMGRALRLAVLAEGVETKEQLHTIQELGCDLIQGFFYARPMPAEEVWAWLTARPEPDGTLSAVR